MALETPVQDIEYKRGDSRAIVFRISDADTELPLDVTLWTAAVMSVNSDPAPTDETNEKFKVIGTVGGTDGLISFSPTSIQTDLAPDTYFYDAQVLDDTAGKLTFVKGKFKLVQDIAKD